jgi:regulator of PEP synthase PpsR (kinase-PPPase family)
LNHYNLVCKSKDFRDTLTSVCCNLTLTLQRDILPSKKALYFPDLVLAGMIGCGKTPIKIFIAWKFTYLITNYDNQENSKESNPADPEP